MHIIIIIYNSEFSSPDREEEQDIYEPPPELPQPTIYPGPSPVPVPGPVPGPGPGPGPSPVPIPLRRQQRYYRYKM